MLVRNANTGTKEALLWATWNIIFCMVGTLCMEGNNRDIQTRQSRVVRCTLLTSARFHRAMMRGTGVLMPYYSKLKHFATFCHLICIAPKHSEKQRVLSIPGSGQATSSNVQDSVKWGSLELPLEEELSGIKWNIVWFSKVKNTWSRVSRCWAVDIF